MKAVALPSALSLPRVLPNRTIARQAAALITLDAFGAARRLASGAGPVRRAALVTATTAVGAAGIAYAALDPQPVDRAGDGGAMALTEPPPLLLRDLAPETALSINHEIPFSREPNPAAAVFKAGGDKLALARAVDCLTAAVYYEAASETPDGQRGVAQVVLNRVRHPAFPQSICGVVFQGSLRTTGCQFSFTCDGSLRRRPSVAGWIRAMKIAEQAIAGAVFTPVGNATHYHADYVVPYWATSLAKNAVVGNHIFYRWPGWWGQPAAFSRRHSGTELDPQLLRNAALRRFGTKPIMGPSAEDLAFAVDPRVELINIVRLLAARADPDAKPTPYEAAIREHFAPFSEDVAVLIYRQLAAADADFDPRTLLQIALSARPSFEAAKTVDPDVAKTVGGSDKLAGFIAGLRDFAVHSDFDAFFRAQQPFYAKLEAQAREPAFAALVEQERESGTSAQPVKFVLAPLLHDAAWACEPTRKGVSTAWVLVGSEREQLKEALSSASTAGCSGKSAAPLSLAFMGSRA